MFLLSVLHPAAVVNLEFQNLSSIPKQLSLPLLISQLQSAAQIAEARIMLLILATYRAFAV
jgi:hypothetical protein